MGSDLCRSPAKIKPGAADYRLYDFKKCNSLPARTAAAAATTRVITPPGIAATVASGRLRPCFVHVHGAPVEFRTVELRNSVLRVLGFCHFDKAEAARLTCITICHDTDALYASISRKCGMKIVLAGLVTEISDKNVCHSVNSFK